MCIKDTMVVKRAETELANMPSDTLVKLGYDPALLNDSRYKSDCFDNYYHRNKRRLEYEIDQLFKQLVS